MQSNVSSVASLTMADIQSWVFYCGMLYLAVGMALIASATVRAYLSQEVNQAKIRYGPRGHLLRFLLFYAVLIPIFVLMWPVCLPAMIEARNKNKRSAKSQSAEKQVCRDDSKP